MSNWQEIYKENYRLDKIWEIKFSASEPHYFEKECIAFLVELGELVNETKIFKFWSIKKSDKERILEELADCIIVIFHLMSVLNIDISYEKKHADITDILKLVNYLFSLGTKLLDEFDEKLVKELFENLMYLSELLNLEEIEVIEAIKQKHLVIEKRLNSDY